MKNCKGQAIVEFAVVLPLFLLVLFGIIYCGMLFYDYSSLSNLVRSSAREAAITQGIEKDSVRKGIQDHYSDYINGTNGKKHLITSLYTPDTENPFKVTYNEGEQSVGVTITMKRNVESPLIQMVLPDEYKMEYYMKRDEQTTTPGS